VKSPADLSESDIQTQIVEWLQLLEGRHGFMVFSVPNEGKDRANPARLAKLKRMGFRAGAPDLIILKEGQAYCLEVKKPGGVWAPAQIDFADDCLTVGVYYAVAYSFEEAQKIVTNWRILALQTARQGYTESLRRQHAAGYDTSDSLGGRTLLGAVRGDCFDIGILPCP